MVNSKSLSRIERAARAFALRKAGLSYRDIGIELGVNHVTVYKDVQASIKQFLDEAREHHTQIMAIEAARLDDLQRVMWEQAAMGDRRAIETVLKIMERRAKLLGLDTPVATKQVNVTLTPDELATMSDDELRRMLEQFS
jgi:acyl carrier protein phosphodiesterase